MEYISYAKCACGAVTVHTDYGDFSCLGKNKKKLFPGLDFRRLRSSPMTGKCQRCELGVGLDTCRCGSGKLPEFCDNNNPWCGQPYQALPVDAK